MPQIPLAGYIVYRIYGIIIQNSIREHKKSNSIITDVKYNIPVVYTDSTSIP